MNVKRLLTGNIAILFLLVCSTLPAMAQGVGGVGGTVADASGAVLPGATVTLVNASGAVGGLQTTVSDERGGFQFLRLVPGTYNVTAELDGFRRTVQENVVVNADTTANVDIKLEIGTLEEGIVVSGQAPLLDITSALRQTTLTREVLEALPNRNDLWSVARVVPSIILSKLDVGGTEGFAQSSATMHGSSNEGGYLIDGMNVEAVSGTAGAGTYMVPYIFEEVNYQTSAGGTANSPRGGLQFNMITRSGTNQLRGAALYNTSNPGWVSDNLSSELRAQLLAAVPAPARAANPNINPGGGIKRLFDYGGWIGGPVVRDRLWFFGSFFEALSDQYPAANYNLDGTKVLDDNVMWTTGAKASWQVTRSAQLSYFNYFQFKGNGHRTQVGTAFASSDARAWNYKYPDIHQMKFTTPFRVKFVLDASWSHNRMDDAYSAQPEVPVGAISRFDSVLNSYTVASPSTYFSNQHFRDQVMGNVGYFSGRHDVSFGYMLQLQSMKSVTWSTSGITAVYRLGIPDSVRTYNTVVVNEQRSRNTIGDLKGVPPPTYRVHSLDTGLYIQDKWTPTQKLTLNFGLRLDTISAGQDATCRPTNAFFTVNQCFEARTNVPRYKGVVPRFSGVYDVAGDGKTALKFTASRYHIPILLNDTTRTNPLANVSDTRPWTVCAAGQTSGCDLNGDLLPQLNELGPSSGYALGNLARYSDDLEWPVSNEYGFEIQRQFPGSVVVSVGFIRREQRRNYGTTNVAVPTDTYIPLQVTETNSGRQVTVYNQAPTLRGANDLLIDNTPLMDATFNGWDISALKRMSNRWSMNAGISYGKSVSDIYGLTSDLNNPNFRFRTGLRPTDVPWSYRLSGVYDLPYGISVSGTGQYYKGFLSLTTVSVGNNTVALTQGTTSLTVEPAGTTRLPNVASVDMSIRKNWASGRLKVTPRLDIYNLVNNSTITARVSQLGPTYGRASTIQLGRLIKLGIDASF